MALGRRGARLIVVDGAEYRWRVRPRPTYCQEMGWSALAFAVERVERGGGDDAAGAGAVLVVDVGAARPDSRLGCPSLSVLPSTVAAAVRLALGRGWRPDRPGRPFLVGPEDWAEGWAKGRSAERSAARGPAEGAPPVPGAA
ncbi:hypothetical protein [Peterkaempfera bronchialis]|uniref:Uncharacterized protein n=1 Tax=Peterkaempfera bronchialis TaxID=2126346 RepID=A0A345T1E7_9ACTN|nr:hypothetical protein [Peterkaempfera bronchialis]AXI79802.1 hypothetical protein C7M71_022760 [Peterkaempfera bronchialis]